MLKMLAIIQRVPRLPAACAMHFVYKHHTVERQVSDQQSPTISSNQKQIFRLRRSVADSATDSATSLAILIFFQIWAYFGFIGFNGRGSVATKSVAARSQSGCKVYVSIALDTVNFDIFVSLLFREMSISEFFARS